MNPKKIQSIHAKALQEASSGNYRKALPLLKQIAPSLKQNFTFNLQLAQIAKHVSEYKITHTAIDRLMHSPAPNNLQHIEPAYNIALAMHRADAAEKMLRLAEACAPQQTRHLAASFYERTHQLERLETLIEKASMTPEIIFYKIKLLRRTEKPTKAQSVAQELEDLHQKNDRLKIDLFYERALIEDLLENYDQSFHYLKKAKHLFQQQTNYDRVLKKYQNARVNQQALCDSISADDVDKWNQLPPINNKQQIAFVSGHPRSGTTLVERLLGQHPEISTVEESIALPDVVRKAFLEIPKNQSDPDIRSREVLDALTGPHRKNIWKQYVTSLTSYHQSVSLKPILVDRHPMNMLYLPIFCALFPQAPMVIILRDPRDVCLSFFSQSLNLTEGAVALTSLEATATQYMETMATYLKLRELMPERFLEVRYEDLASTPEKEHQRLLQHLGAAPSALAPTPLATDTRSIVMTPSYEAVTKPISSKAVGRWKNYGQYFDKAEEILQPAIQAFGYRHRVIV